MRDLFAAFRWIVLPWGATSGQRLVLDGVNGLISAFDTSNDETTRFDTLGLHFYDAAGDELVLAGRNEVNEPVLRVQDPASGSWVQINIDTNIGNLPWISLKAQDAHDSVFTHVRAYIDGVAGTTWRGTLALYANGAGAGIDNANLYLHGGSEDGTLLPYIGVGPESLLRLQDEIWHNVGTGTEPAFQNTFANLASYEGVGFTKTPDGMVRFKGACVRNNLTVNDLVVFTLPVGYRPAARRAIPVASLSNLANTQAGCHVRVYEVGHAAAGAVALWGFSGTNPSAFSFDGCEFNLV